MNTILIAQLVVHIGGHFVVRIEVTLNTILIAQLVVHIGGHFCLETIIAAGVYSRAELLNFEESRPDLELRRRVLVPGSAYLSFVKIL